MTQVDLYEQAKRLRGIRQRVDANDYDYPFNDLLGLVLDELDSTVAELRVLRDRVAELEQELDKFEVLSERHLQAARALCGQPSHWDLRAELDALRQLLQDRPRMFEDSSGDTGCCQYRLHMSVGGWEDWDEKVNRALAKTDQSGVGGGMTQRVKARGAE